MNSITKINYKILNKAELARKTGYSREYIRLLLSGKRKNREALLLIKSVIKEQLKAA